MAVLAIYDCVHTTTSWEYWIGGPCDAQYLLVTDSCLVNLLFERWIWRKMLDPGGI